LERKTNIKGRLTAALVRRKLSWVFYNYLMFAISADIGFMKCERLFFKI